MNKKRIYAKVVCEFRYPLKKSDKKGNLLYPLKLRITYQRERRYFSIGVDPVSKDEWLKIESGNRISSFLRETYNQIVDAEAQALVVINSIDYFSFGEFKRRYFGPPITEQKSLIGQFNKYIESLTAEDRIGTATSYQCALNSLLRFKKSLKWHDLNPGLLEEYEGFMVKKGRSQNTIGIYLRSLRTIVNLGMTKGYISREQYPFGKLSHGKYQIPSSLNVKKALTKEEIDQIKGFEPPIGSRMERGRDFWLFSYYINGLNMKDIAHLKWKNIDYDEGMVRFIRKKTERANKGNQVQISAVLTPFAKSVIEKYSPLRKDPDGYVFPILDLNDDAQTAHKKTRDFTKGINIGLKQLCQELGIQKKVTTYSARHSHATILLQSGASLEQIMDQFKHSSMKVTMNYIGSITDESRKDLSKLL